MGIEIRIIWDLVDDVGQVCEEVSLVLVGEDGGDACIIELDVLVVDFDEVDGWVAWDERSKSIVDDL
jgi:hypothetical protein